MTLVLPVRCINIFYMNPQDELDKIVYQSGQIPERFKEEIPEIKHQEAIIIGMYLLIIFLWLFPSINFYYNSKFIELGIFTFVYLFLVWGSVRSIDLYFNPIIDKSRIKETHSYFLYGLSNSLDMEYGGIRRGRHLRKKAIYALITLFIVYLILVYQLQNILN